METREVTERVGKVHLEIHEDVHAKGYLTCKLFLKILKRHKMFPFNFDVYSSSKSLGVGIFIFFPS